MKTSDELSDTIGNVAGKKYCNNVCSINALDQSIGNGWQVALQFYLAHSRLIDPEQGDEQEAKKKKKPTSLSTSRAPADR